MLDQNDAVLFEQYREYLRTLHKSSYLRKPIREQVCKSFLRKQNLRLSTKQIQFNIWTTDTRLFSGSRNLSTRAKFGLQTAKKKIAVEKRRRSWSAYWFKSFSYQTNCKCYRTWSSVHSRKNHSENENFEHREQRIILMKILGNVFTFNLSSTRSAKGLMRKRTDVLWPHRKTGTKRTVNKRSLNYK